MAGRTLICPNVTTERTSGHNAQITQYQMFLNMLCPTFLFYEKIKQSRVPLFICFNQAVPRSCIAGQCWINQDWLWPLATASTRCLPCTRIDTSKQEIDQFIDCLIDSSYLTPSHNCNGSAREWVKAGISTNRKWLSSTPEIFWVTENKEAKNATLITTRTQQSCSWISWLHRHQLYRVQSRVHESI